MVLKGKLQKKKHMAGEKYGVERRKNRRGGYEITLFLFISHKLIN